MLSDGMDFVALQLWLPTLCQSNCCHLHKGTMLDFKGFISLSWGPSRATSFPVNVM